MTKIQDSVQGRIWQIVKAIPSGKVATYGQIARLAGMPTHARLVGKTLRDLPAGTTLPWHRVLNGQGKITNPHRAEQEARLQAEGLVAVSGRINLQHHGWQV